MDEVTDDVFFRKYFKRLEENRELVKKSLLSGEVETFDEYKYKSGLYEGIGRAALIFKELVGDVINE